MLRFFLGLCLFAISPTLHAQTINRDASYIKFEVKNMGKTVEGTMKNMQGEVHFDPNDLASAKMEATVAPATVESGVEGRNKHLKRDDFFDVATYPAIQIVSKSVRQAEEGYVLVADLTIKSYTQEVEIPFTVHPSDNNQHLYQGSFTLERKTYDLGTAMGKLLIGLDVTVSIHAVVE